MKKLHWHTARPLIAAITIVVGWSAAAAMNGGDDSVTMNACRGDPGICKFFQVTAKEGNSH